MAVLENIDKNIADAVLAVFTSTDFAQLASDDSIDIITIAVNELFIGFPRTFFEQFCPFGITHIITPCRPFPSRSKGNDL